jgi:hypothetical protein
LPAWGWRRATAASHSRLAATLTALVWVPALLLARHGTARVRAPVERKATRELRGTPGQAPARAG